MINEISSTYSDKSSVNVADGRSIAALLLRAGELGVARLDAEVLLGSILHWSRAQLGAYPEHSVTPMEAALIVASLERRADGEPVAYITGIKEFWSLPLVVTPDVLIPRPETELLVELCLARFDAAGKCVADLGTGSGAIALALAKERAQWRVLAVDASVAALQIAALNAQRLAVRNVEFLRSDWCSALPPATLHCIVSNPPYVDATDAALAALTHEPRSALVAEQQGYADLLAISQSARQHLVAGGALLLEHGATQAEKLGLALARLGYVDIRCHQDLAGRDRVTMARWP